MKERPIHFTCPLVRLILDGHKTQHRFVIRNAPSVMLDGQAIPDLVQAYKAAWIETCRLGKVGDRLWVKETFAVNGEGELTTYMADKNGLGWMIREGRIQPSTRMKRKDSRLTLEITDVRAERLQEISEEDAKAEGAVACSRCNGSGVDPVRIEHDPEYCNDCGGGSQGVKALDVFPELWDSIHKKGERWSDNPWVLAISFKRLEKSDV